MGDSKNKNKIRQGVWDMGVIVWRHSELNTTNFFFLIQLQKPIVDKVGVELLNKRIVKSKDMN